MKPEDAKVGATIRHKEWPDGVYGTVNKINGREFTMVVTAPKPPPNPRQSYVQGGPLVMLADFNLVAPPAAPAADAGNVAS